MRKHMRDLDKEKDIKYLVSQKAQGPNATVAMGDRTPRHWESK